MDAYGMPDRRLSFFPRPIALILIAIILSFVIGLPKVVSLIMPSAVAAVKTAFGWFLVGVMILFIWSQFMKK